MKTITLVISPTGETQLQTQGFQGSQCKAASAALEQALGLVTQDQPTTEFYKTQSVDVLQQTQ